ncbi:MAG TPA: MFS transporter [Streptosporangiales bacterium]
MTTVVNSAERARLRRVRVALLAAALATFALLYAPQPVLPQIAAGFHLTPAEASLTISAATAGLALAGIPLAAVSDVLGRRRLMIGSLAAATGVGLLLPLAGSLSVLVALRVLQGVAIAGVPSVVMAYVADELPDHQVTSSMGIYVAGTSLGGLSGRLVAGLVGDADGWPAGVLAVGTAAAALTVVFVVLVPAPRGQVRRPPRLRSLHAGLHRAVSDPVLFGPYLVALLGMGGFVAVYNVLSFRLIRPPIGLSPALASLAFLAYLAGSVSSTLAGWAAARIGRTAVVVLALTSALGGLVLAWPDRLPLVLAGLVVFTAGFFAAHSAASAWVGTRAAASARSQAAAVYLLAYYVGSSVGGVIGSAAYGSSGWTGLTVLVGCWLLLATVAALGAAVWSRRRPR